MIRRALVALAIVAGSTALFAGTSNAGDLACAYNVNPLNVGVCVSV